MDFIGKSNSESAQESEAKDAKQASTIDYYVNEINMHIRQGTIGYLEAGRLFNEPKQSVDHGCFDQIRQERCSLSKRTAQRYALIAEAFWRVRKKVAHLDLTLLEKLASKEWLSDLKDGMLRDIVSGQDVDLATILAKVQSQEQSRKQLHRSKKCESDRANGDSRIITILSQTQRDLANQVVPPTRKVGAFSKICSWTGKF